MTLNSKLLARFVRKSNLALSFVLMLRNRDFEDYEDGDEAMEVPTGYESDPEPDSEGEGDLLMEDEKEFQLLNDFIKRSKRTQLCARL